MVRPHERISTKEVLSGLSSHDRNAVWRALQFSCLLRRRQEVCLFQNQQPGALALQYTSNTGPLHRANGCSRGKAGPISWTFWVDYDRRRVHLSRELPQGARRMVIPTRIGFVEQGQTTCNSSRLTPRSTGRLPASSVRDTALETAGLGTLRSMVDCRTADFDEPTSPVSRFGQARSRYRRMR